MFKLYFRSTHKRGNKMVRSDIGARLRNERIRAERRGESAQVSCHKDRERV